MNLRIGSRGSQLALWQANHIAALLRSQGHSVEIQIIKTTGDKLQEFTFAQVGAQVGVMAVSKGIFTKEIEEALADGRVDLAVHSLKDLPTELPASFALAATPPRADARDVFVSVHHASLGLLPLGARVGTSSSRRRAQLKALRPDVEVVEFRGNVDTRLRKLAEGQADAILLAAAGLDRLEKTEWLRERLEPRDFCPAAGQGALGIETREGDEEVISALAFLDDPATRFAVTAERAALTALGGGCQVPIGIHCRSLSSADSKGSARVPPVPLLGPGTDAIHLTEQVAELEIFGVVAAPDSGATVRIYHRTAQGEHRAAQGEMDAVALGRLAAKLLLDAGAGSLLAASVEGAR